MIYLIITVSLQNKHLSHPNYYEDRMTRYRYAIESSLKWVTEDIQPVIVENNGQKGTFLEDIIWRGNTVPVVYTSNNVGNWRNKGVNELLDIQDVIHRMGIKGSDIIIKLTGRYRLLSAQFLDHVKKTEAKFDLWMKFYNVSTMEYDQNDCILGLYAVRAQSIEWMSYFWLNLFDSPEKGVAKYMNQSVSRIYPINHLDLECLFSENGRILEV